MSDPGPPSADEVERRLGPVLAGDPRVRFAYLFGSVARGEQRTSSDVDVAVMLEPRGTLTDDATLHDQLAAALPGTDVDLMIMNGAPLWMRYRAVAGRVLISRDDHLRIADRERVEREFLDFRPYHEEYLRATRERARRGVLSG
ncbi:MAG: type VII toxin-antitoxin system MntA family adenylyltransferase antitoxin [Pseudonocardia sp.]